MLIKKAFFFVLFLLFANYSYSQWLSINNTGALPDSTAALDISASNKGILLPRLTLAERLAIINPANGLLVYQTTADTGFHYFNGIKWLKIIDAINPIADALNAADTAYWNSALTIEIDGDSTNELELPTTVNPGDMVYWNGSAWVTIAASANDSATLQFVGGVPTWVGGVPPISNVTNPTTGKIWMDRNLGATQVATSSTDIASYGDLYQWGRGADGHQLRTSSNTTTLSSSDTPGHADFITVPNTPYDWRSNQNDNLWQGISGVNNPCPSGYRVPTDAELDAERLTWSSNSATGAFNSVLKLPTAGYRYMVNGLIYDTGITGYYWSSTVNAGLAKYISFSASSSFLNSSNRATGYAVRCIKN